MNTILQAKILRASLFFQCLENNSFQLSGKKCCLHDMPETKTTQRIIWTALGVALLVIGVLALNKWLRSQELVKPTRKLEALGIVPDFTRTKQDKTPLPLN